MAKAKAKGKAKAKKPPAKKQPAKAKPKAKAPKARVTKASPAPDVYAAEVYTAQVADIIRDRPRDSGYRPVTILNLSLARVRAPKTVDELTPGERAQLEIIWQGMPLDQVLANDEFGVEVAEVVDGMGTLRFHLYAWNFGVGYLMRPEGMDVVAFASQHDMEHWDSDQRDLFVAMDNALRAPDHGLQQPLCFCWWDEACWAAIAGKQPGSIGSEPHLRQTFAAALAARGASAQA